MMTRALVRTALVATAVLAAWAGAVAVKVVRNDVRALRPARHPITAEDRGRALESLPGLLELKLNTRDGLRLAAWYAPGSHGDAIVLAHGAWTNRAAMLDEAVRLAAHGYGVLLYDARAHGESEGDLSTWGDREREDVAAVVDFLAARPEVRRIGAIGLSVGSTAVATAAAQDERLGALVLEATTPSYWVGTRWEAGRYGALKIYPDLWTCRWYGIRVEDLDVAAALKRVSPRPVLIVAGSADPFVPQWMTDELFAAASTPKELYVVQGAGHGRYVEVAGDAYLERLVAFFDAAFRAQR
jgi:fermentation-respiration switch protein FrsA (DUF1100 family)